MTDTKRKLVKIRGVLNSCNLDANFTKLLFILLKGSEGGTESECGRPLGMRLVGDTIIAVDGYLGIYSINILTG